MNEVGGMRRHVTSFAAPIVVSLIRLSIDRYEILFHVPQHDSRRLQDHVANCRFSISSSPADGN
ncbi:hypothetical protein HanIR_Chr05g0229431 [Helianthus annuus]|nr:hypothetical protein HanIR_Chr05g0229431 [Helianthus annuus]